MIRSGPGLAAAGIGIPRSGLPVATPDGRAARHVLCYGDSTVEGVIGGFDSWIQLLRLHFGYPGLGWRPIWRSEWKSSGPWTGMDWKGNFLIQNLLTRPYTAGDRTLQVGVPVGPLSGRFLIKIDEELLLVTGGNGTTVLSVDGGQFATVAADHRSGATVLNPCNIGPYQSGFATVGGSDAHFTWSRPDRGWERPDLAASFRVAVSCGEGAGDTISTSTDDGETWHAVPVVSEGPPAIQLIDVAGADRSTPTIKVRAADGDGNPSPIAGLFGLMAYPTTAGELDGRQTVISNCAHSEDFLFNLNGTAVEDQFTRHRNPGDSVLLATIGPYTNDVLAGEPQDYYTNLVDLAAHYSRGPVLVIGAFEQQGVEVYPCTVRHGSPHVVLSSDAGNLTQPKDGGNGTAPGRPVWVAGYPHGGGGLAALTYCGTVQDRNSCVLTGPWTGTSGPAMLTFGGRDIGTQSLFRAKAKAAAADAGCAYLDLRACWGSFRAAYAKGLMQGALHESQQGHRDIAARIQRLLAVVA